MDNNNEKEDEKEDENDKESSVIDIKKIRRILFKRRLIKLLKLIKK